MTPRRKLRLALATVTLLVGLGAAEVALRVAWRRTKKPGEHSWHDHDDRLGWRNKRSFTTTVERSEAMPTIPAPFLVRTNAQGLRDARDLAPEPSSGVTRIACVGDSYTFGFCIAGEAAYPARLEARLGAGHEVCNWGVCAYGLDQFVLMLDDALATKPSLVILGVIDMSFRRATSAHFLDGTAKPRFYLEGERLLAPSEPVPLVKPGDTYCRFDVRGPSYVLAGLERAFANLSIKLAKDPAEAAEDWQLGRALLREAARKCKTANVRLAVALLPEERLLGIDPYERLLPTLEPEGIVVLDTYPAFKERFSKDSHPLFVPLDGHPNEPGSQLIADTLAAGIEKRGLLAR
jgi:lysophospholipase L1-like esterase